MGRTWQIVYHEVKICHRGTLPSATPSFQVGKNFENRKKHQRRRKNENFSQVRPMPYFIVTCVVRVGFVNIIWS